MEVEKVEIPKVHDNYLKINKEHALPKVHDN